MKRYRIEFVRVYEDTETIHTFFVYAVSRVEAKRRFCMVTGLKVSSIRDINEVADDGIIR